MNERKEEKRVTSIARKINLQNVGSMLLAYLWVDILVCIVLAAVMIYGLDVQLAGRFDITYARKLMIETSVWDMVYQVGHKGSSVYYLVEIGPWLIWFMIGGCVVLVWELVEIIKAAIPAKIRMQKGHPAKQTFQAIRIELNRELTVIDEVIDTMIDVLKPGGRLCIITFHSLEDRIVKSRFRTAENPCICPREFPVCVCGRKSKGHVVTRKPILPSETEMEENPRARSAKLRVFEKES